MLIFSEGLFGGLFEGFGEVGGVGVEGFAVVLFAAADGLEQMFVAPGEAGVPESDGVLAFGHLAETVHVELNASGGTCLRNDLKLLVVK
jgi:hypothetical protein